MATGVPPKKNAQYVFDVALVSQADGRLLQSNPTLATGDVKVSTDEGALANLGTLPTVTPAAGKNVKVTLSASEMNGDNIAVIFSDAAGAEWCDLHINIQTATRQIDDLAYPATSGRSMVVDAAGLVDSNAVKVGPSGAGTAQTARDIGLSVLLSSGAGTGQLDFTAGVVKANATQWLGGTIPAVNVTGVPLVDVKYLLGTISPAAAGSVGIDWAQVANKTSTVGLTGTTIGTLTTYTGNTVQTGDSYARLGAPAGASLSADLVTIAAYVDSVESRLPTALVGGRMDSSVGAMAAAVVTATAIASDAITDAKVASDVTIASVTGAVGSVTGNVGGNVAGSVGSVTGLTASNLDATVSSRLASASYTAPDNATISAIAGYVDTEVAAIKTKTDQLVFTVANQLDVNVLDWKSATAPAMTGDAFARLGAPAGASLSADVAAIKAVADAVKAKTDNLPSDPADASDIAASFATVNSTLSTIGGYIDTEVAAIKAKTDNLPSDPADASDVAASFTSIAATLSTIAGYIDTEVAAIKAKTDNLPAAPAATGDIPTANQNADALLDRANGVEVGLTPRQALRLSAAADAGKISGAATNTNTIRNAVADSKDRIVATVDADGNRTAITYDLT